MKRLTKRIEDENTLLTEVGDTACKCFCDNYTLSGCWECPVGKAIEKLADYEDAEEQGLLVRLSKGEKTNKKMIIINAPNTCDECPFSELINSRYYCNSLHEYIGPLKKKKHSTIPEACPLKSVLDDEKELKQHD